MTEHRDSYGRTLADYPRPSIAVDTAVLTLTSTGGALQLTVLEVRRSGSHQRDSWALPGTFIHEGERLADAVTRSLREKAGAGALAPTQLHVFDAPGRDDRGWVLSVAHVAIVARNRLPTLAGRAAHVRLAPVASPGRLPYDHVDIVKLAVVFTQARYEARPDPDRLLGHSFTQRELRQVHEAIAGRPLQRDTFRRAMEPHLVPTGSRTVGMPGRPAARFTRL